MAQYSYNGWLASKNPADFGGLAKLVVAGEEFSPGVRAGDVHTVLQYVAEQLHRRVEPVVRPDWHQADDWGYSFRPNTNNPNQLSCHASGTAFDYNATRHPNGKGGSWTAAQVAEIKRILAEVDNVVACLFGYDEMHFEISGNAAAVARVASRLRAPAPAPSNGARVLKQGDAGEDVKALQRVLDKWYPFLKLVVDGVFGPATDKAVRELQTRSRLQVDGIVGPATRKVLGL
jgi:murein L,D-transpeptidase YcbB/YkuD